MFAAALACGFVFAQEARALEFEVDGVKYNQTSDTTCEIVQYHFLNGENALHYSGDFIIPDKVKKLGTYYTVTGIADLCFYGCKYLSSVTIPETVTYIGKSAFLDCSRLKQVTVPQSVSSIGENAFNGCEQLQSVDILGPLETLAAKMFIDCLALRNVKIPETVTSIGANAFNGCESMETIDIPDAVVRIGENAFEGCSALADIILPPYLKSVDSGVFIDCEDLRSVTIPQGVSLIGNDSFRGCLSLPSIVLPQGVTSIGEGAFSNCSSLQSIVLPQSVTSIGEGAFSNCSSLLSVEIPDGITILEDGVFNDCTNLQSVVIPSTVTNIGSSYSSSVFRNCTSLKSLELPSSVVEISNDAFKGSGLYSMTLLKVTNASLSYKYYCGITGIGEMYFNCIGATVDTNGDMVTFSGLQPDEEYKVLSGFYYNGGKDVYRFDDVFNKTADISFYFTVEYVSPVELLCIGKHYTGDAEVTWSGFADINIANGELFDVEGDTLRLTGLEPGRGYYIKYVVEASGKRFETYKSVTMPELEFTTLPAEAISNTVARICADTNLPDGTEGTGFEWRRYDAPDEMPSSTAECPVIDGKLTGTLNNLSQSTYYKFRPYYTSENGKTQYGEWVAFITADAYVYFEPTVRTYEAADITETTAAVSAAAVQGSDAITEQGFEYWPTATRSAAMRMEAAVPHSVQTVTALGQVMTATLEGLQPGTGYTFRAYAKTAKGTTYGNELTFTTQTSSGIQSVPITGGAVETARYDAAGRKVSSPVRGLNIVVMSDGSVRKEIVR